MTEERADDPATQLLTEEWIASAAVDVLETQPLLKGDTLLGTPNFLIRPHMGAATTQARRRMAEMAVQRLRAAMPTWLGRTRSEPPRFSSGCAVP